MLTDDCFPSLDSQLRSHSFGSRIKNGDIIDQESSYKRARSMDEMAHINTINNKMSVLTRLS